MISQYLFVLWQFSRKLWVRATLITLLAFLAAALTPILSPLVPERVLIEIEEATVRSLLDILANSMLAVTTFSLTIMVTAHLSADQAVSPRAHRILRDDGRTQTVLATFLGAFVYALVGIVMLQIKLVSEETYPLLYGTTLGVIGLIIATILRWIARLAELGSVEATVTSVEGQARETLRTRAAVPFLGARPLTAGTAIPENAHNVTASGFGFVQHIDTGELDEVAERLGCAVYCLVLPGDLVAHDTPVLSLDCAMIDDDLAAELAGAVKLGDVRSFAQDPGFALSVLVEVAERALSPSVNDPQTALSVIARLTKLLLEFPGETKKDAPASPRVFVRPIDTTVLVRDTFDPIARDGRTMVEVGLQLQASLRDLSRHREPGLAQGARIASFRAAAHADEGLSLEADRARVRALSVVD